MSSYTKHTKHFREYSEFVQQEELALERALRDAQHLQDAHQGDERPFRAALLQDANRFERFFLLERKRLADWKGDLDAEISHSNFGTLELPRQESIRSQLAELIRLEQELQPLSEDILNLMIQAGRLNADAVPVTDPLVNEARRIADTLSRVRQVISETEELVKGYEPLSEALKNYRKLSKHMDDLVSGTGDFESYSRPQRELILWRYLTTHPGDFVKIPKAAAFLSTKGDAESEQLVMEKLRAAEAVMTPDVKSHAETVADFMNEKYARMNKLVTAAASNNAQTFANVLAKEFMDFSQYQNVSQTVYKMELLLGTTLESTPYDMVLIPALQIHLRERGHTYGFTNEEIALFDRIYDMILKTVNNFHSDTGAGYDYEIYLLQLEMQKLIPGWKAEIPTIEIPPGTNPWRKKILEQRRSFQNHKDIEVPEEVVESLKNKYFNDDTALSIFEGQFMQKSTYSLVSEPIAQRAGFLREHLPTYRWTGNFDNSINYRGGQDGLRAFLYYLLNLRNRRETKAHYALLGPEG